MERVPTNLQTISREKIKKEYTSPFGVNDINTKVLRLLACGSNNSSIANELGLRIDQLEDRLRWIGKKIGANHYGAGTRQKIVEKAIELKLIPEVEAVNENKLYKSLTPTEIIILEEMAKTPGISNKELGQKLNKTQETVNNQLISVFRKLGVKNRFEAVIYFKARQKVTPDSVSETGAV